MENANLITTLIYGNCVSLPTWKDFLKERLGSNLDRIEENYQILACEFALLKGVSAVVGGNAVTFKPLNY